MSVDTDPIDKIGYPRWRSVGFQVAVWALLGALYFFSPMVLVVLGWFQEPFSELGSSETVSHRVHEVVFGVLFTMAFVGVATQIRSARARPAGMLQAIVVLGSFFVVLALLGELEGLGFLFLGLALLATGLHPSWETGWWREMHPRPALLVLVLTGGLPLLSLTTDHLEKAGDGAANHVTHWGGMAAFTVALGGLALVAALRPPGYRLVAGSVGLAGGFYLAASLVFPFDASSRSSVFGVWLLIWSVIWLLVAFRPDHAAMLAAPPGDQPIRQLGVSLAEVRWGLMALGLLILGLVGLLGAVVVEATNVPHGLEGVAFADIDRAICLDCHRVGREGATVIPHEPERTCGEDESCWGGRTDCIGCHRFDPVLGGPKTMLEVGRSDGWKLAAHPRPLLATQAASLIPGGRERG